MGSRAKAVAAIEGAVVHAVRVAVVAVAVAGEESIVAIEATSVETEVAMRSKSRVPGVVLGDGRRHEVCME